MAKRKRRSVPKDRKTKVPKKYLSGLSRSAKDKRASLLKREQSPSRWLYIKIGSGSAFIDIISF